MQLLVLRSMNGNHLSIDVKVREKVDLFFFSAASSLSQREDSFRGLYHFRTFYRIRGFNNIVDAVDEIDERSVSTVESSKVSWCHHCAINATAKRRNYILVVAPDVFILY